MQRLSFLTRSCAFTFLSAALVVGCGAPGENDQDLALVGQSASALSQWPGDDSDNACDGIMQQLQMDGLAMQGTEEYQALAATPEYARVEKDVTKMQSKGCSMKGEQEGESKACAKLRRQAMKHQQALLQTPEFEALSQTPQFKKFVKDARKAQQEGCLDDMGGLGLTLLPLG